MLKVNSSPHILVNKPQNPLLPVTHEDKKEEEDDYEFIDFDEIDESEAQSNSNIAPWLCSKHPLFMPATQEYADHSINRWDALNIFSIENWYLALQTLTFRSVFLSLNHEDILFLMHGASSSHYQPHKFEKILNKKLNELHEKTCFVRLSTRSPKDSTSLFDSASNIMRDDHTYWPETSNKNQQLVSLTASLAKAMKVKNGKEIIELLQNSNRIYNDLLSLVSLQDSEEKTTKIILREWVDIRPDHEFRVFISRRCREKSIVTAISQYFHFLFFDNAPTCSINTFSEQEHTELKHKINHFVLNHIDPKVSELLNFSSEQDLDDTANCIREYIADIAIIPSQQYNGERKAFNEITIREITYTIVLIELNPFSPAATGSALFNWKSDLNILWGKADREYPVYAYRTSPCENMESISLLPPNYKTIISDALDRRTTNHSTFFKNISDSSPPIESTSSQTSSNSIF